MQCQALIILSNIDGLYDGNPSDKDSHVIREVGYGQDIAHYIRSERSSAGRGGMQSKCTTATDVAAAGIHVFIANGKRESILTDLLSSNANVPYTHFMPHDI
jgi:glutamate 5-kinase